MRRSALQTVLEQQSPSALAIQLKSALQGLSPGQVRCVLHSLPSSVKKLSFLSDAPTPLLRTRAGPDSFKPQREPPLQGPARRPPSQGLWISELGVGTLSLLSVAVVAVKRHWVTVSESDLEENMPVTVDR